MVDEKHIFSAFEQSANRFSSKAALSFRQDHSNSFLDYRQLFSQSIRLGHLLRNQGVQPDDKVALLLDNQPEFPLAFFAVMSCGAVAVPLDVQTPTEDLSRILSHCSAKLLITNEKRADLFRPEVLGRPVLVVDSLNFQQELRQAPEDNDFSIPDVEDKTAVIFYTSGTTAQPKGVMLSHQNLLENFSAIKAMDIVSESDVVVSLLPLHHAYAFTTTLLTPLLTGATVVYSPGYSSAELSRCMRDTGATILVGVPQLLALLERSIQQKIQSLPTGKRTILHIMTKMAVRLRQGFGINLSTKLFHQIHQVFGGQLRFLISGGAKLDENVAKHLYAWGFTILEGYGLTETAPVAAFNPIDAPRIGTVGKPLSNVEIQILGPDAQGVGEVLIKGPNVMQGYYNNPDETRAVLKDGWFYSGDLGCFDQDGYLKIVGRKKELIVLSNGKNIVPEELEQYYGQNPYIQELAVLAAKGQGFSAGTDQLVAVIVIDEDHFLRKNEGGSIHNRIKWELDNLTEKLPTYKRICGFVITTEPLPRTRLGKIKRYQLEGLYRRILAKEEGIEHGARHAVSVQEEAYSEVSQAALAFFQETLGRKVALTDHLELDLGLDSLGKIELLLNLQERLNLNLDDNQSMSFFMCVTVSDLLEQLKALFPENASKEDVVLTERHLDWQQVLKEDPAPDTIRKIALSHHVLGLAFNLMALTFFKILFKVCFWLRVEGKEHLPQHGPYLICPNHTSYFDGLFVVCALPYRVALNTYFVGHSAFFDHFLLRPCNRLARLIPIEMNFNMVEALKAAAYVLRNDKIVCYFPEGQRSIDGEVQPFRKGVGILSKEMSTPVVPVYLEGAFKTWPRKWRWPRLAKVTVHFSPVRGTQDLLYGLESADDAHNAIALNLQNLVSTLKQQCINK